MRLLVESHNLCRWLRLKVVQPVKKITHHFQSSQFHVLHLSLHFLPHFPLSRVILELEELLLERDWVVEEELGSVFENLWDGVLCEVQREDVGELENRKAIFLARVLGKRAERAERA